MKSLSQHIVESSDSGKKITPEQEKLIKSLDKFNSTFSKFTYMNTQRGSSIITKDDVDNMISQLENMKKLIK